MTRLHFVLLFDPTHLWIWKLMMDETEMIAFSAEGYETRDQCLEAIDFFAGNEPAEIRHEPVQRTTCRNDSF